MINTLEEVEKLSLAEKRKIYELLLADEELQSSLNDFSNNDFLFQVLENLDNEMQEGKIKTISLEAFESRLLKGEMQYNIEIYELVYEQVIDAANY
jgi:hypothetical protein